MISLFFNILNMSLSASMAALFVMLVRIPLKKAPKIYSYALWGLMLFKMLCPFSFSSGFSLMPAPASIIPQDIVFVNQKPEVLNVLFINNPTFLNDPLNNVALPSFYSVVSINHIKTVLAVAEYVWPCVFAALLLYAVIGYIRLKRQVYYATLVRENIYETDQIKTPFVLGFIRPKIYIPTTINPSQYDFIIEHERSHIKRRDYLIKPAAFVALALHWFNPLLWLSYFLMSKDMEMSCDEAALLKAHGDIRHDYSSSLLHFSTGKASFLCPLAFGENNTKSRVKNVLRFKKPALWVTIVAALLVVTFLGGFSFDADFSAFGQKVIDDLNVEDIASLGVYAVPPNGARMIEDTEQIIKIVDLIKTIEIEKRYLPINNTGGQLVQYLVDLNSGKMTAIGIYGSHVIINGQWYIAKTKACEQLSSLGIEIVGYIPETIPGMDITGMTQDDFKIVEVSDDIRSKIINLTKKEFLDGYGMTDGEELSVLTREYLWSVPKNERINVSYTLTQIHFIEAQRLSDIARERIPGWQAGDLFDRSIFDDVIFGQME